MIAESWKRSVASGVDAGQHGSRKISSEEDVNRRRQLSAQLREAAFQAFGRLAPHLKNANTILILADELGVIIDAIGDPAVMESGQDIHLEIGGVWSEGTIGTNGIGTALKTGQPTYVHAAEHFVEGVQAWTCAGVPIRDPIDQSVIGVVDLSGPPQIFREHNLALVMAAAREIEIALAEQQRRDRTLLLEAFLMSDHGRASDSVILLDKTGRIQFRRGLDDMLFSRPDKLAVGRKLLPEVEDVAGLDLGKILPPELKPRGLERLNFEGTYRGAALFLNSDPVRQTARQQPRRIKPRSGVAESEVVIVGTAPKMLDAIELAERAAAANVTVLIQGETGVGKELFARLVHSRVPGKDAPYVTVNCAAIARDLIGSDLFGYVEGAFTGAARGGRPGKFELADGGVLCLDEIGDMPIEMQPYLLRALEQRAVYRIGDSKRRPVDVRLVAMTNRDLRNEITNGKFRRDLFYRIGVVTIEVPPLRERGEDLLLLIEHFCHLFARETDRPPLQFTEEAIAHLRNYRWPGNVRELRNVVQRLFVLTTDSLVTGEDLPPEIRDDFSDRRAEDDSITNILSGNSGDLESIEACAIRRALVAEKGNLTRVAAVLGISRPTLYRKLKQYHIERR
ncbi:sigma-54-dependent Fis family transcriptional regulator [Tropicimonas isoalkanivorans]|uniref:Nif-specific regulatory protein n=1 Tax=Tropicimonas isoalkanivorans TaxID=441112 RepID=A0A1I1I180_9RHOB|nr:sigma-54-dependent Fis family transcriptional regulator [Tropicimonas isoalkanivorans]SFC29851.1 Transcriptional regulator of acetoin/glycerol metabolism [Tropicimonas isoalkanivorans]